MASATVLTRLAEAFVANRGGNFATMSALAAPLVICLGALAVDEASFFYQRREVQALADLAAINAAAHLDDPEAAALDVLRDNGVSDIVVSRGGKSADKAFTAISERTYGLTVQKGRYDAGPSVVAERFVADARPYNAVKVSVRRTGTQYFSAVIMPAPAIGAAGVASAPAEAAFSIGSRLLRLDGGLLNKVLSGLTGSQISLTAMDYESLAGADIDAFRFSEALATKLHLQGTTYADVLKSRATVADIASVMADLGGIDRAGALAATAFARQAVRAGPVELSRLLDLGSAGGLPIGHAPAGLGAKVSALDVLTAAAALANGTHQVQFDLATQVPGLLSATVDLAIGEPPQASPWFTVGQAGAVVRTAQTRLKIVAEVGGPGGLIGASIKVPLYVEVAFAEGELTDINCSGGKRVTVAARPGIAALRIADIGALDDFRSDPAFAPATLVKAPLLTVRGSADIEVAEMQPTPLSFTAADIDNRAIRSVSTKDITRSLTGSLLDSLHLDIKLAGVGLALPSVISKSVKDALGAAAPALDRLVDDLLVTLGVRLGEADVRVTGLSCGRSVLVQ